MGARRKGPPLCGPFLAVCAGAAALRNTGAANTWGRGGRSKARTTRRRGSRLALHLPGWRRARGAAPHGGRVVTEVEVIPTSRCTSHGCRVAALAARDNCEKAARPYCTAGTRGPAKGENRTIRRKDSSESVTSASVRKPQLAQGVAQRCAGLPRCRTWPSPTLGHGSCAVTTCRFHCERDTGPPPGRNRSNVEGALGNRAGDLEFEADCLT